MSNVNSINASFTPAIDLYVAPELRARYAAAGIDFDASPVQGVLHQVREVGSERVHRFGTRRQALGFLCGHLGHVVSMKGANMLGSMVDWDFYRETGRVVFAHTDALIETVSPETPVPGHLAMDEDASATTDAHSIHFAAYNMEQEIRHFSIVPPVEKGHELTVYLVSGDHSAGGLEISCPVAYPARPWLRTVASYRLALEWAGFDRERVFALDVDKLQILDGPEDVLYWENAEQAGLHANGLIQLMEQFGIPNDKAGTNFGRLWDLVVWNRGTWGDPAEGELVDAPHVDGELLEAMRFKFAHVFERAAGCWVGDEEILLHAKSVSGLVCRSIAPAVDPDEEDGED